jgi:hypothetical protein
MAAKKSERVIPKLTADQAARTVDVVHGAMDRFAGSVDDLEAALGMYVLGHYVGWKVLVLIHSKRTIRKYEEVLGIKVREEFPEEASESHRSIAYRAAKQVSNFWKAVSGEAQAFDREERKTMTR